MTDTETATPVKMVFVIGAPRSGTTMLERMLSAHSQIQGGPEPHLLTPLAHLGVWDKVNKAPYDHVLAAQAQKGFVAQLPRGEDDYWEACRAYCDVLYNRYARAQGGKPFCLDKTPAYALVLPFIKKVYPDAAYIVLTRHPLAIFSSYANSFFNGDYDCAHEYNPIVERYVPALAAFLRSEHPRLLHVPYEALVRDPEQWFERICAHIGVAYEADAVNYGENRNQPDTGGLGDPIGVSQHTRPSTASVKKWVAELATDQKKLTLAKHMIAAVHPDDLALLGYPLDSLWEPLLEADESISPPKPPRATRYRMERRMIMSLRALAGRNTLFRRALERLRLMCDVLLRE